MEAISIENVPRIVCDPIDHQLTSVKYKDSYANGHIKR